MNSLALFRSEIWRLVPLETVNSSSLSTFNKHFACVCQLIVPTPIQAVKTSSTEVTNLPLQFGLSGLAKAYLP